MKKCHQMMLLLFLFAVLFLSGCKKEADAPSGEGAEQESQAEDFVEIDGSLIERITVYHGEYQETVDAKSAKGKALIKMASSFFENPKASSLSVVL